MGILSIKIPFLIYLNISVLPLILLIILYYILKTILRPYVYKVYKINISKIGICEVNKLNVILLSRGIFVEKIPLKIPLFRVKSCEL